MRWKDPRVAEAEKRTEKAEWHPFYAWHPVTVEDKRIWLEWVERRIRYEAVGDEGWLIHREYRWPQ